MSEKRPKKPSGSGRDPLRAVRVAEDVWRPAMTRAKREGRSLSSAIVAFLREYGAG